jgi:glutamate formiminotransferase/formiminotetrahydrofolate cyclodeaminase
MQAAAANSELSSLVQRDSAAYEGVMAAYRLPKETPEEVTVRQAAVDTALLGAARVPLETARVCARVARLAALAAERGNTNAASDAGVAALLAEAGCRAASYNVQINIASLSDAAPGRALLGEMADLMEETARFAQAAAAAVQRAIAASAG